MEAKFLSEKQTNNVGAPDKPEVVITRVFDAPRELVWKAWTECERFMQWWGPKGFTAPVCKIDLRVGGKSFSSMRSPEGKDFYSVGVYKEIVAPSRIVVTDSFADKDGNVVPATYYGMSGSFPLEMLVSVNFEDVNGKTKMTLRHSQTEGLSDKERTDMQQGWIESFDKLEEYLTKSRVAVGIAK
jgi:uncharacterized protein YndB with AHSA1/START domain